MDNTARMALVTGAARRLGREIALGLAREGYAIGLHYHRSQAAAEQTAQELQKLGVPILLLQANLQDPQQIEKIFTQVDTSELPLRVLVNSAAIMPRQRIGEITVELWDETLDTNLRAPLLCSQAAARRMPEGGVIINLTDTGVGKTWINYGAYSVSKAGLETLTRLCARAFAPSVRVNGVAPGLILPSPETSPEEWEKLTRKAPFKQAGSPEDIVQAVLFLVKNEYITGEILHVDGGYGLL